MRRRMATAAVLACVCLISACPRRAGTVLGDPPVSGSSNAPNGPTATTLPGLAPQLGAPTVLPAGTSCAGRDDCPSDQLCVRNVCRFRATSAAGEILAAGAAAQVTAGELTGALRTYDEAIEAYRTAGAPVPAEVTCAAALASLRVAHTPELREGAAKRADRCFRASVAGDALREDVANALSRMRFDGLDAQRFDRPEPPDRFFALAPSRPTADAVSIAIDVAATDNPGFQEISAALRADPAKRAIVDCFIQDWDVRHQREASAGLLIRYESTMRDMGDYDTYEPSLEVAARTAVEDGFEPCLARALSGTIGPGPRMHRVVAWQHPFEVSARLE